MADALSSFDFNKVSSGGLYLKFEEGKAVKLRVLTTDPLVYLDKFGNTRFAFVVYNLTDGQAQILQATAGMARRIGELHVDADYGANIQKIDIKITPSGSGKERRYAVDPLTMNIVPLTQEQLKEAAGINLEDKIAKNAPLAQRMSFYDQEKFNSTKKKLVDENDEEALTKQAFDDAASVGKDEVVEDIGDEPINLDDIPF